MSVMFFLVSILPSGQTIQAVGAADVVFFMPEQRFNIALLFHVSLGQRFMLTITFIV